MLHDLFGLLSLPAPPLFTSVQPSDLALDRPCFLHGKRLLFLFGCGLRQLMAHVVDPLSMGRICALSLLTIAAIGL